MSNFRKLFQKVGGFSVLKNYAYGHVLFFSLAETALVGLGKKSLEIVRLAVTNKLISKLRRKYRKTVQNFLSTYDSRIKHENSGKIWMCWLQGIENAPKLVQACYHSIKQNIPSRELVVITESNYREYVSFPNYIQDKIDRGIITKTHFSDLLRLELLNRYGGTWIDATVYISSEQIPEYMLSSDLFMFQVLKPGLDGHAVCMSSWFMTAYTNHPILLLTQKLLYEYWKTHDRLVDYFLLHDFLQLSIETFPKEWARVMPFSSSLPHILLLRLFDEYDETVWCEVRKMTPVHKLTYKFDQDSTNKENTYYKHLFG